MAVNYNIFTGSDSDEMVRVLAEVFANVIRPQLQRD